MKVVSDSRIERCDEPISWWLQSLIDLPAPDTLACLAPAETLRAGRFAFERDRRRYLAARCALRERLAQHTGVAMARLQIANDEQGKPFLPEMAGCHFNLSHSEDLALIAISDAGAVGVDIEMLRPVPELVALAQSQLTPQEMAALLALGEAARDAAFLRVWTRKEACLKAIGTGLRVAPNQVPTGMGREGSWLAVDMPAGAQRVEVRSVLERPDCVAAIARVHAHRA